MINKGLLKWQGYNVKKASIVSIKYELDVENGKAREKYSQKGEERREI